MNKKLLVLVSLLVVWAAQVPVMQEAAAAPRKASKKQLQERRFRELMRQATAAAKKNNHAAAIALYEKALAIQPGNLEALTDQGWSAFLSNDLEAAERITRSAIEADGLYADYRIIAAAWYNLGRVLEAKNDRAGAIAAYEQSLGKRPNRVVRERLGTLDPAAAAAADPLRPQPMQGPFATLADFCKTLEGEERTKCPSSDVSGNQLTNVGAPYQAVGWVTAGTWDKAHCFVWVQTNKGWFFERQGSVCRDHDLDVKLLSFGVSDLVPGGNLEVVMRVADRHTDVDFENADDMGAPIVETECLGWLTACGVGQTNVPSCLKMQFARARECGIEFKYPWDWQLEPVFSSGQVEVKGTGVLDADARALMGRRPLAFP